VSGTSLRRKREVGYLGSVLIFSLIVATMVIGRLVLGFDTAILLLFISIMTTAIYMLYYGFSWKELFDEGVVPMAARAMGAILIMLAVGVLIAIWIISGTIPYMMYLGLKTLSPQTFLVVTLLITTISSLLTGTSWGTASTFGVALMGVAHALGVPLPIAAAAIVVGSYLGDKISPVSDTTILASATAEVDIYRHIKSMLYTTLPGYFLSFIVYAIVGLSTPVQSGYIEQTETFIRALQSTFKLHPVTLIPPILLLTSAALGVPALITIWIGILSAIPIAMWQGYDIKSVVTVMARGPAITTGVKALDNLLNRGGVTFMASAMAIVLFAWIFAGELERTGTLAKIAELLRTKFIKDKPGRLVFATSITGILTAMGTGSSYLSIITPGIMYKKLYDMLKIDRAVLSRTLEDSGTVVVPLIPWAAAGVYMTSVLGVPTEQYAVWAIMNYAGFITAWIYGFTNKFIWRVKNEGRP